MMERRAHWTDDLIAAVIVEIGVLRPSPPPLANTAYAVITAVEDWVYDNFQGGEYDNPVEYTPEERAIQRVQELCDLTERTVLDAMPELEGKVVVYTSLVRRALDGGDA